MKMKSMHDSECLFREVMVCIYSLDCYKSDKVRRKTKLCKENKGGDTTTGISGLVA